MTRTDRGRTIERTLVALATLGLVGVAPSWAQQRASRAPAGKATTAPTPADDTPKVVVKEMPANPDDPIAVVNGETITRSQLADECVARRGKEVLDTLINRKLVEQALKAKKLDVTGAEIDAEITKNAAAMGVSREAWLRELDKQRGVSPIQYARDVVWPILALRRLASPMVQVTAEDLKSAFEAQFGEKLKYRMIIVDKVRAAQEIWEELKKNPGGFEKVAQENSLDVTTRSLGGLVGEPMTRHAYPLTVSDAAFKQLVDGDSTDRDPKHKPKDGDITGPIQVSEAVWAILQRVSVIPGDPKADIKNERTRNMLLDMMFEAKLQSKMTELYQDLMRAAAVDNRLTGQFKMANQEIETHRVDGNVELMSNAGGAKSDDPSAANARSKTPPPAALSKDALQKAEALKRSLLVK
jgi:foldase protein PrsA